MFSMFSELTPRAPIPDSRIAQFMQPWMILYVDYKKAEWVGRIAQTPRSFMREA